MSNTHIMLRIKGRQFAINIGSIVYVKAEGCYSILFTDNHTNGICISKPLSVIKTELLSSSFLQCHRSTLVNTERINGFDSKKKIIRAELFLIQVSKRKAANIFRFLSKMGIPDKDLTVST